VLCASAALGGLIDFGFCLAQVLMRAVYDPQYFEFIARLRNVRKSKNYTQADLAELLNKPQSFVSKVETCERRIDVIEAARWCFVLGVPLQDLIPPVSSERQGRKR
jgi:ribosome-binding protein aMBF1 (putative translation factor)